MPHDNRTTNFDLAVPHPDNTLADDVPRLIATIIAVDALLAARAPLVSPALSGNPTAPTQAAGNNSSRLATTAFVMGLLASPAFTGNPTAPTQAAADNSTRLATTAFAKGLLASTVLTGTPVAPTPTAGDRSTRLATTAYVMSALDALIAAAPGALDTLNELAAALGNDPNFATTMTNLLAGKASLDGATFSGAVNFNGTATLNAIVDVLGSYRGEVFPIPAANINCTESNYFTKTVNGAITFTFSNVPANRAYGMTIRITHTSGAITWPASVKWPKDTAPLLTLGKVHLFGFETDDGGATWRGAVLQDYTS